MREQDKSPEPKYGPMGISEHNIIIIQLLASRASIQFLAKYWSSFAANPPDFRAGLGPCSKIDTLMMSQRIAFFTNLSFQKLHMGLEGRIYYKKINNIDRIKSILNSNNLDG